MLDAHRLIKHAFSGRDWGGALEAWYEALGVSVLLIDPLQDVVLRSGPRAGFCDIVHGDAIESVPFDCLTQDSPGICRGGSPYRLLPLEFAGETVARVMICGYTTSSDERREVAARLSAKGMSEEQVRALVRGIPVIPKRRMAAVERMVVQQASAILERAAAQAASSSEGFIESLGTVVRGAMESPRDLHGVAGWILEHAIAAAGGTGGLIALAEGSELRTMAERGEHCPASSAAVRRAFRSGKTSVGAVPGSLDDRASCACVPLAVDSRRIGVLAVTLDEIEATGAIADLERFAASASSVLGSVLYRQARDREVYELMHISEVARALHKGVEVNDIAPLVASVLEKALDFTVGGIVLTGYGVERAAVVVKGAVARADIDSVILEAAGRESLADLDVNVSAYLGEIVPETAGGCDWTVLSQPLDLDGAVIGYLFAACSAPATFDAEDQRLLERLGEHVAVAFNRSALFERLNADYTRAIEVLSAALDASEGMKPGHSGQVMEYAMRIGEEMSLQSEDLEVLRFAGLVHDIGKIGVSEELLLKPARLSEEEMAEVRRHSEIGATLLEQVGFLNSVAPAVLHHHERWDGRGYPMQLSGEDIPLLARILAVSDAYASMTADTPYRPALTSRHAESELVAGAGTLYDPRVVAAMTMVLQRMHTAGLSGLLRAEEDWGESLPA